MQINLNDYDVEIIRPERSAEQIEFIKHLQSIIIDRHIPERNKNNARAQLNELIRLDGLAEFPPKILLTKKHVVVAE